MVHLYLPVFLSKLYVFSFSLQWFCKKSSTNSPNPATDLPKIKSYDSLSLICIYMNFSLYNIHLFQCHFVSYLLLCNKLSPTSSSLKQIFIIWPSFWKLGIQKQLQFSLVQFSRSVVSEFFDLMDCSMPGFPVLHHLLELAKTHGH